MTNENVNVNVLNIEGDENKIAALHIAVMNGNVEIIKLLLGKKDININIEDSQGKKPIDYTNDPEIINLLSH